MWIVRLALKRPYTFVVLAILILILGTLSALRTPTDIFPNINIPVVSIIWNYSGLAPQDMANRIISLQERNLTTTVNDIEHLESQSLNGIAVIKVFFHPGANISTAIAQIAGQSQTQLKQLPVGTTPPLIITYSASSVPILQLALSSPTLSEQQLNDLGLNFIRPQLTSVPGTAIPYPYGGKQRQVQVDLNTAALQADGLSPLDVVNAIHRDRFHHFRARAIGVIQVHLTLAIGSRSDFQGPSIFLGGRPGLQRCLCFRDVGHFEADVMRGPSGRRCRQLVIQHELDIRVAVRHSHVDPVQNLAVAAAAPELLEPEDVTIKLHRRFQRAYQDADMHHA